MLPAETGLRHLTTEHGNVALVETPVGAKDAALRRFVLCLYSEAHERHAVETIGHATPIIGQLCPPLAQVRLEDLRLIARGELLDDMKGTNEGCEDAMGKLERKLLGAAHRRRLGARQVSEPVREVEGHVAWLDGPAADARLEGCKGGGGRRLCLHEPAMVEGDARLREANGATRLCFDHVKGRQQIAVVVEHVGERRVMVVDRVTRCKA
mmetsp:Transcript_29024/g.88975  ORF Transcript_29024/g.88975 Transcript_29024/m.88975 type:complete len:210 (+) Transcript_29024:572-1201(+)